jgi:Origin of replication binding protein
MLKTPTTTQEKRYVSLDNLTRLSCVRSPKGTGKTELIDHIVNNELGSDEKALILVHRVALSLNTRGRIGGTQYQESPEAINNSQVLHLCVNSLVNLEPRAWNNIGVVVIDELEQVLKHIAGDTCKRTRNQIRAKLQYVLTKAKRVLILDADLTDRGVETIQAVAGVPNEETETVLNTFEVKGKQYFELPDMPTVIGLAQQYLDNGERVVIFCNTKRGAEAVFKDLGCCEGLLVTKDTSDNPKQKDFLTAPNEYVEKYNLIVGSPSITTGLSIDEPIDAVFLVANRFDGLDDKDLRQALGRVRNPRRGYFFIEQPQYGSAPDIESVVEAATRQAIKRNRPHTIDIETGIERLELSPTDLAWFKNDCAQEYEKTLSVRDLRNNFVRGLESEGCTVVFDYFGSSSSKDAVRALEELREHRRTEEIKIVLNDSCSALYKRIQGLYGTSGLTREQVERYLNKDLEAKREQFYLTFAAPLFHLKSEDKVEQVHMQDGFKPRCLVETKNLRLEILELVSGGDTEALLTGNQVITEQVLKDRGLGGWLSRNKNKVTELLGLKPERQLCRFVSRVLDQLGLGFDKKQCGARNGTTLKGISLKRGEYYYTVTDYGLSTYSIKSGLWEYVPYGQQPKEYLEEDEVFKNWF